MQLSIVDQATEAIRRYVFDRQLVAGERLPSERILAEALGTSRPAVREALRRLVAERVIEVRGRSGIYIASVDADAVFTVRIALEPLAAELAATRRSEHELRSLESDLKQMRTLRSDPGAFSATDRRIHATIAHLSGNAVLEAQILQLIDLTLLSRGVTARSGPTRHQTLDDVRALVAAIGDRRATAAHDAMLGHLVRIRDAAVAAPPSPLPPPITR